MKYIGLFDEKEDIVTKEKLETKQDKITGAATTITDDNLTASHAIVSDANGKVAASTITSTELGYLDGVTSNVQTQLNKKLEKAPVTSVNSKTGAVTLGKSDVGLGSVDNVKQYSASNPPPYPVTSVNGATGEVKSTFYVTVTQGNDDSVTADKTAEEVYAAYAAGYAVYAIANLRNFALPSILPMVIGVKDSGQVFLGFTALTGAQSFMLVQYGGDVWSIMNGTLASSEDIPTIPEYLPNPNALNIKIGNTTTSYDGSAAKTVEIPEGVPSVTTSDNGKFLRVVNGSWAAAAIDNANGVKF